MGRYVGFLVVVFLSLNLVIGCAEMPNIRGLNTQTQDEDLAPCSIDCPAPESMPQFNGIAYAKAAEILPSTQAVASKKGVIIKIGIEQLPRGIMPTHVQVEVHEVGGGIVANFTMNIYGITNLASFVLDNPNLITGIIEYGFILKPVYPQGYGQSLPGPTTWSPRRFNFTLKLTWPLFLIPFSRLLKRQNLEWQADSVLKATQ